MSSELIIHKLESFIYKEVCGSGYPENKALACASALFDCLALNFDKSPMYIPTIDRQQITSRRESIWTDFTGSNHAELGIKYHLSTMQIYTIIKMVRASKISQNQTDIFPVPEVKNTKQTALIVLEDYLPNDLVKCGLSDLDAVLISKKTSAFLLKNFPGISILFSDKIKKKHTKNDQISLF